MEASGDGRRASTLPAAQLVSGIALVVFSVATVGLTGYGFITRPYGSDTFPDLLHQVRDVVVALWVASARFCLWICNELLRMRSA